jgi:hypothetical protein
MIIVIEYRYHSSCSITVITYVSVYCISITKMSDTCTLSQLSPMYLLLYCISITKISHLGDTDTVVRDIGDNCDRVQVSLLVILIQCTLSQLSPMYLLLYCISITKISDTCTLSHLSPNCDRVQVSLILVILIQ